MINEINEMSYPEMKQKLVELYGKDVSFLKGVTALYLRVQMLEVNCIVVETMHIYLRGGFEKLKEVLK